MLSNLSEAHADFSFPGSMFPTKGLSKNLFEFTKYSLNSYLLSALILPENLSP